MKTEHRVFFDSSDRMQALPDGSVGLIVTSPPYPMIEMWDHLFITRQPSIGEALKGGVGEQAFEGMHQCLDPVWNEAYRVLKPGGIACINIGDATRTINGDFRLYPNHSRILGYLLGLGFSGLPNIIWRKQTNAPNKFMGSGTLPCVAYVTLEHEYILIVKKGLKRRFETEEEKQTRRESAFFWEERNLWFSDVWTDLKGTGQQLSDPDTRGRSAAFPFELAYRLINMFSIKGDLVLDPFVGTGTTMAAAMAAARNSVSFEMDPGFQKPISALVDHLVPLANTTIHTRLDRHRTFVTQRAGTHGPLKYVNRRYGFPVVTRQETELFFDEPETVGTVGTNRFEVAYGGDANGSFSGEKAEEEKKVPPHRQKKLF